MKIIIVGDGKVGYTLAELLTKEKHNVTIIDNNAQALLNASETLDVICVRGNGASSAVLEEAGIRDADLLIAATSTDELNIVCCLIGKKLGVTNTIARVRNPEYADEMHMLRDELGLSMIVNPEQAAAREISRLLRFPAATKIETFVKGRVELAEFKVRADDPIVDRKIADLPRKVVDKTLFCAIERNGNVIIPGGQTVILAGDVVYVTGEMTAISRFFRNLGRCSTRLRDALIIGGGRISVYLVRILEQLGFAVKLIEIDQKRCEELADILGDTLVIHADGTEQHLLESEGIRGTGAFVALTDNDEENLIASMFAVFCGVPKVVTKINRLRYTELIGNLGIDSLISPKQIAANNILQYVRAMQNTDGSSVRTLYKLLDGKVEAIEFIASQSFSGLGIRLSDLKLKNNIIIGVIVRDGRLIFPRGSDAIQLRDSVIVVSTGLSITDLNEVLQ